MRRSTVVLLSTTLAALVSADSSYNPFPFSPGFDIQSAAELAFQLPSHSWEYGTAAEALLELYNPEISVFGDSPFPVPTKFSDDVKSLAYAKNNIVVSLDSGANGLSNGDGAVGDPASLGVSAVMLGKTNFTYSIAAGKEMGYIVGTTPKWWNGAISQRADVAELWADFMYMAPPFLAYYAVDTYNSSLLKETVDQCTFYRDALHANTSSSTSYAGLWEHIVGPQSADLGLWGTGNGWASGGMTRVLATVMKAPSYLTSGWKDDAVSKLTTYIKEIVDGAMGAPTVDGLLRNYLNDTSGDGHGFGDISGTTMIASVVYRMAVLQPDVFASSSYIDWADAVRKTMDSADSEGNSHITANGTATPAVNPLCWQCTEPWTAGSPEGQNFVVLMYAAWRDCVQAGICEADGGEQRRSAKFRF